MSFIDLETIDPWERLPGWKGRIFESQSMTFGEWTFQKGSQVHEHRHPAEEVWLVLEGELEVTVDGEQRTCGPGTVAIVPPDAPHRLVALSDGRALAVDHPKRDDESPDRRVG